METPKQVVWFEKYRIRPDGTCEKLVADDRAFTVNVTRQVLPRSPFAYYGTPPRPVVFIREVRAREVR